MGEHKETVPTSQFATASPRSGAPPHQRPATDVVLPSDPVWRRLQPTYPAIRWPLIAASGGKTGVHRAPRDCTYTLYEHSGSCQPPCVKPSRHHSHPEASCTVARQTLRNKTRLSAVWDHWLYRRFAIAPYDCYRRLGATDVGLALRTCISECRGTAWPSCRSGSSR